MSRDTRPPTPTPTLPGSFAVGIDDYWSDDDLDIEEDDEFRKRKLLHDKKTRQAEKVWNIEDGKGVFSRIYTLRGARVLTRVSPTAMRCDTRVP